jgi:acyl-CoA thioesterase-1
MFELRRRLSVTARALLIALGSASMSACEDGARPAPAPALPGEAPSKVAAAASADGAAGPAIPADAPLVVFLGDSISAGLHLSASEAFPAVLQRELAADGHPFRLVNAGVSGDTSAGGLRRIDWILKQAPDVVVVELGGNDGLRGQELTGVESNLRAIVTRAVDAGARVVLLGVQIPTSYGAEYSGEFGRMYARIAADLGVAFVPEFLSGVGGVPDMTLEDGLHPTARGHEQLARNVAPVLSTVIGEVSKATAR